MGHSLMQIVYAFAEADGEKPDVQLRGGGGGVAVWRIKTLGTFLNNDTSQSTTQLPSYPATQPLLTYAYDMLTVDFLWPVGDM